MIWTIMYRMYPNVLQGSLRGSKSSPLSLQGDPSLQAAALTSALLLPTQRLRRHCTEWTITIWLKNPERLSSELEMYADPWYMLQHVVIQACSVCCGICEEMLPGLQLLLHYICCIHSHSLLEISPSGIMWHMNSSESWLFVFSCINKLYTPSHTYPT